MRVEKVKNNVNNRFIESILNDLHAAHIKCSIKITEKIILSYNIEKYST